MLKSYHKLKKTFVQQTCYIIEFLNYYTLIHVTQSDTSKCVIYCMYQLVILGFFLTKVKFCDSIIKAKKKEWSTIEKQHVSFSIWYIWFASQSKSYIET